MKVLQLILCTMSLGIFSNFYWSMLFASFSLVLFQNCALLRIRTVSNSICVCFFAWLYFYAFDFDHKFCSSQSWLNLLWYSSSFLNDIGGCTRSHFTLFGFLLSYGMFLYLNLYSCCGQKVMGFLFLIFSCYVCCFMC